LVGPPGFIGAMIKNPDIKVVADFALHGATDMVMGANRKDYHLRGVSFRRDLKAELLDLREARNNDPCGQCGAPYTILRGIEVGHIFYLGKKYSKALKATFQNQHGESVEMEMGCYGIGVGRTAAAAIEQNHDDKGIIWPAAIAPYQIHVVQLGIEEEVRLFSLEIYEKLSKAGLEVLLDDRDERAGVKLNDADLLGLPLRISVGKRGLKNGEIEVLPRRRQQEGPILLPVSNYVEAIKELLKGL
jgi:prolyl-tRNA synthetase